MELTTKAHDDGALVIRHGRKEWRCSGNGAAHPAFAEGCPGMIAVGEEHLECLWSAPAFASGTRHCIACARAFFPGWVA